MNRGGVSSDMTRLNLLCSWQAKAEVVAASAFSPAAFLPAVRDYCAAAVERIHAAHQLIARHSTCPKEYENERCLSLSQNVHHFETSRLPDDELPKNLAALGQLQEADRQSVASAVLSSVPACLSGTPRLAAYTRISSNYRACIQVIIRENCVRATEVQLSVVCRIPSELPRQHNPIL
jgi:hypothetical protein